MTLDEVKRQGRLRIQKGQVEGIGVRLPGPALRSAIVRHERKRAGQITEIALDRAKRNVVARCLEPVQCVLVSILRG